MLVYRIENQEGQGVYGCGYGHRCDATALYEPGFSERDDVFLSPCPDTEPKLKSWWGGEKLSRVKAGEWMNERRKFFCGFESPEQMLRWFPLEGLELMANLSKRTGTHQMIVNVYEVSGRKVKKGDAQVMFVREEATLIRSIPVKELVDDLQNDRMVW